MAQFAIATFKFQQNSEELGADFTRRFSFPRIPETCGSRERSLRESGKLQLSPGIEDRLKLKGSLGRNWLEKFIQFPAEVTCDFFFFHLRRINSLPFDWSPLFSLHSTR